LPSAEFSVVLIFSMSGAMLIAASTDLLLLFLGLELMVLPGYLLAGFHKTDGYSTEGAVKYFLLGSFSSAIFLFGLSFVWGLTGTTRVAGVAEFLQGVVAGTTPFSPGLAMGFAFITTGVAFKIAAVPFHYWTPDAYQGSPTPVTGQRQADARLQLDRPHRLHARWAGGVRRRPAARTPGTALLRRRLLVHESRRFRCDCRTAEAGRSDIKPRNVCRPRPTRTAARCPDVPVPPVS